MNKRLIIILSSVLALVVLGAVVVYFVTSSGEENNRRIISEEDYIDIKPEDLGFEYELREDNTGMTISFDKLEDVNTLEYDISYTKEIEGRDGPVEAPGGVPGEFDVSDRDSFEAEIDFGTCSSGRCVFDDIVSEEIVITVRAEFKNSDIGLFEEEIPLN